MPGSESESPEGSPHWDSYSKAGVGDLDMEAGMELKERCKWGRRCCWRGTFCSYSKDVGHCHPHISVSKIECANVDITAEAELELEWEGYGR